MNKYITPVIALCVLVALLLVARRELAPVAEYAPAVTAGRELSGSWNIFRGDAALSGMADAVLADRLRLSWSVTLGNELKASPVVEADTVYVGADDGVLYAVNLHDGSIRWRAELGAAVEAPALWHGGMVYVGDMAGVLHALAAADGTVAWRFQTGGQITGSANVFTPAGGGAATLVFGSHDTQVYALDAHSGEKRWAFRTGNYINGAPAIHGALAAVAGCDNFLRLIDIASGAEVAAIEVGSYVAGSVAVAGDMAYLGHYGNQALGIDMRARAVRWRYGEAESGSPFFSSPAVAGEIMLIGCRDRALYCLSAATGELRWRFQAGGDVDASPVVAGDKVVMAALDGRVYILRAADGTELYRYDTGAPVYASPCVIAGAVIIAAGDGRLLLFESAP